jgi:hypothetical protein
MGMVPPIRKTAHPTYRDESGGKLPHPGIGVGHGIGKQILRIAKGQDFAMSPGTLKKVLFILDMISELAQ